MEFLYRGQFKVGDVITPESSTTWYNEGEHYTVTRLNRDGVPFFLRKNGEEWDAWGNGWALVKRPLSPNDTVRLKSGEPFTTGAYTALVDSAKDDIVLLKHGSWLPLDAVEKVEAGADKPTHRFKVGDRVVNTKVPEAGVGVVESLKDDPGCYAVHYRDTWYGHCHDGDDTLEPAPSEDKPSTLENLVVTLSLDLAEYEAQLAEAARMTNDAMRAIAPSAPTHGIANPTTSGNDNDDFVTVSISGHPVAVADFLAVLR